LDSLFIIPVSLYLAMPFFFSPFKWCYTIRERREREKEEKKKQINKRDSLSGKWKTHWQS
jgi:hypothetical protein